MTTPLGDHSVPTGWPQDPYKKPYGGTPGAPVMYEKPSDPEDESAGYGYSNAERIQEKNVFFYHSDHLGSTSYITDLQGNATQFVSYKPYGEALVDEHATSFESPWKFNGKELDSETGLYYYGARYYDPVSALWYGVDALSEKYPTVGGYVYCHSNPVMLVDPDGNDDYYDENGNLLYHSETESASKFLVTQKTDKRILKNLSKNNSTIAPEGLSDGVYLLNEDVLGAVVRVYDRTVGENNLGECEECELVAIGGEQNGKSMPGKPGLKLSSVDAGGVLTATLPTYQEGWDVERANTATIHSHATAVVDGKFSQADKPGPNDPSLFEDYPLNIIVGKQGEPSINGDYRVSKAFFFNRNSELLYSLSIRAITKILGN